MGIPLYLYLVCHDMKFMLLIGETEAKARKLLSSLQAQLQFNRRIANDYGERFKHGDWAEGDFSTTDGVRFSALGFLQSPRGARQEENRPDYIAIDDVDNRRHVNNDKLMREAIEFITEDVWGCFDTDPLATDRFVFANNNFHKNSITNRLRTLFLQGSSQALQQGGLSPYYILKVCAVKNLIDFTPEWPQKADAEYWRRKFGAIPYRSFMREFMHVHIQDGAVFRHEDIVWGAMLPLKEYDGLCFYGDLSYKAAGDYKAMLLVGKVGRQYHIIFVYLRRGSRTKCAKWLYDLYEDRKLSRFCIAYFIEGLFAMDEFVNVADKRGKADKFDRIESTAGFFERRNVVFNEKMQNDPDFVTLVDQFLAFERGSQANDDGPDAWHGAESKLNRITFIEKFKPRTKSRTERRSKSKNSY